MNKEQIKKYIGHTAKIKTSRTRRQLVDDFIIGKIEDVTEKETCIRGDWHDNKFLEILEVLD